jgi:hypothetical protein
MAVGAPEDAPAAVLVRRGQPALTHYVRPVSLPVSRGMLVSVQGRRGRRDVVVCEVWHAPAATLAEA